MVEQSVVSNRNADVIEPGIGSATAISKTRRLCLFVGGEELTKACSIYGCVICDIYQFLTWNYVFITLV